MTTSKQFQKIKNNNEVYDKEKERINNYIKNKYANNLEFREKIKTQSKERREKLKQMTNSTKMKIEINKINE